MCPLGSPVPVASMSQTDGLTYLPANSSKEYNTCAVDLDDSTGTFYPVYFPPGHYRLDVEYNKKYLFYKFDIVE